MAYVSNVTCDCCGCPAKDGEFGTLLMPIYDDDYDQGHELMEALQSHPMGRVLLMGRRPQQIELHICAGCVLGIVMVSAIPWEQRKKFEELLKGRRV